MSSLPGGMKPIRSSHSLIPEGVNTMLCKDGLYRDPNKLESYFVEPYFGVDRGLPGVLTAGQYLNKYASKTKGTK